MIGGPIWDKNGVLVGIHTSDHKGVRIDSKIMRSLKDTLSNSHDAEGSSSNSLNKKNRIKSCIKNFLFNTCS